ncbi:uncharacterized protein [Mytilus edulis]|uniref:uncharacterized protein n=1 Tax=Mytilus edulis TaxID=6550 RepID=UPI0039EDED54
MKQQSRLLSEMKSKMKVLTKENDLLQRQTFCAENMLISDGNVLFYTGLPNIITFKALLSYFEPKAKRLTYWEGCDTTRRSHFTKGPSRKLNIENELFAVLVRLKLGPLVEDIASRFKISCAQFSKMFNTWIRFLSIELDHLFPYPSMEQVRALMPESFNRFPNTRIILDCTEIFIQKPSVLKAQRQTWSSYKHRNTYKALIGIAPLYGGAASDKFIINDCGILDYIEPDDNVMADRGFEIADELSRKGASLDIPPFRNGNFQLSAQQVEVTRRIAEVRIHVERAIQRIKTCHILDGTMP